MTRVEIEVVQLRTGRYMRPAGQCGTCGFFPVPWEMKRIDLRRPEGPQISAYRAQLEARHDR